MLLRTRILEKFTATKKGYTPDEMALKLNESYLSIRPRFTELKYENLLQKTDVRRRNASGRTSIVWELYEKD